MMNRKYEFQTPLNFLNLTDWKVTEIIYSVHGLTLKD